jgi:Mce-associated membrane protein
VTTPSTPLTDEKDTPEGELVDEPRAGEVVAADESPAEEVAADESPADETAPDAGEASDETTARQAGPARRRRRALVGTAVLAVVLVAAAGLTAWLYFAQFRPDPQTSPAVAQTVLDEAKQGTVATLSYSPEHLDKDLDTAKSYLTGDFLKYYSQFTDDVVRPAVKNKQVSTTANVARAAVSDLAPDKATVLVFVNQATTSADRAEPSMTASSVKVTLDRVDGKWLIAAFDPV